eukprot:CAMPEP_0194284482 /NCGR_PEP_ID=MMETSP0169-20130528/27702_1 /TAXON_ID=218684 /ORGANISM="Corethron pennatum, Strain L29A3" /LENGTH=322 /DNA_ID=CAMNT_0039030309 /DNA_START=24 /DNA_END=992 /DNA_ORIENTATION=+
MASSSPPATLDIHSMSAARRTTDRRPTASRDGFHLIPNHPIEYDLDLTAMRSFSDITFRVSTSDMAARIAFNRPSSMNTFRPTTINEVRRALEEASEDVRVAVILLDSESDGTTNASFCAGGDQTVRGNGGYDDGSEDVPRLRVLDLQVQMRRCPKPVVAVVRGYAVGGGHILHMVSDMTIASTEAVFGQTGPRMGSFDGGYGCTTMARLVGQKRAREMWFLSRFYSAKEALEMGLVNAVCPPKELDGTVGRWVRRMVANSPTAIACTKAALNADQDGSAGLALLAGQATRMFYMTEESVEGKKAFMEGRAPRFRDLPSSRL